MKSLDTSVVKVLVGEEHRVLRTTVILVTMAAAGPWKWSRADARC